MEAATVAALVVAVLLAVVAVPTLLLLCGQRRVSCQTFNPALMNPETRAQSARPRPCGCRVI